MLHLIIGREGTGKTHYAQKLLGERVRQEGKKGILLVPRQYTFESEKGILSELGAKDACEVEVLSFMRLADIFFKTYGGPKKPLLRDGAKAAMMALALSGVQQELHFFSKHKASAGFVNRLLLQIASFKQELVSPDDLQMAADAMPQGYLKEKLRETALIYRAYDAMVAQSFFDDSDVLSLVYEKLLDSDYFDGKIIVIDDFPYFSGQELKLIERMLLCAEDVYITLCADDINDRNDASPFALTNHTARQLRRLCDRIGVPFGGVITRTQENCGYEIYGSDALRHLEQHVYDPAVPAFSGDASALTICTAPSVRAECDLAAMQIRKMLREGNCRCRDIAVVFRSEEPYAKEVKYSLKKCGVPVFEDQRAPIQNEPLVVLVRALLLMCQSGCSTENLMRYLKTGLVPFSWDEIAEVENYALMWDISPAGWGKAWTDNPDGFGVELTDKRKERLEQINAVRARIMEPLLSFRETMQHAGGKARMKCIYDFLMQQEINETLKTYALTLENEGKLDLALEQGQVWDLLMVVLDELAQTLRDTVVPMKQLVELFDLAVGAQSLGKLPDGFDEVFLCEASRISTQMPKVIFVLGMNSGVFPQSPQVGGLFSGSESDLLRVHLTKLPDEKNHRAMAERFYVYNALCSAREKLFVSWAQTGAKGEKLTPSPVVRMLEQLLPSCGRLDYGTLPGKAFTEGELLAFEWMAKHWHQNTPENAALRTYFGAQPQYRDRLSAIRRAAKKEEFAFRDKQTAKKLFGTNLILSASQLETYEECPFRYFCRYGLRAKPRQTAKLDPANAGTVVHFVLEQLLRRHKGDAFLSVPKPELHGEIRTILAEYMKTYMGGVDGKSARFLYLYERMYKILVALLERLLFEFSNSDFLPVGFEVPIGPGKPIEPFRIELEDGYVELHGIVDRIDEMRTEDKRYIRVVDYKTGQKTFSLSDVLGGLGMQMLLYLVSIWRSDKGDYQNVIPAGVLYMPARFEPFDAERGEDDEAVTLRQLSGGKMEGMILDEGEVLRGMDNAMHALLLPVSVNKKTKALRGNFISLQQLGLLAKRMDRILEQMGNALHDGKVPARPVAGKDHGRTCDWCDYGSVCGREQGGAVRYLEKRTHSEALTALEEEVQVDG